MIEKMEKDYPVTILCDVLDCPRSSYYYEAMPSNDELLREKIEQVHLRWPFYGYRRVTKQLEREGFSVNTKAVRRIMKTLDMRGKVGVVGRSTTNSKHSYPRYPNLIKGLEATHPEHIWVADITYIWLGTRFIYLAVIIDLYTRSVRGWHLGRSLSHKLALTALEKAIARYGVPAIHHSDQGIQYAAGAYTDLLQSHEVNISMSAAGKPTQNAVAERFMRTFKEEHYDYSEYSDFDDACGQIAHWIEITYNTARIHSSIGYLTPFEFEAAYGSQKLLTTS